MSYFLDCFQRDEVPMFTVFQNLCRLKSSNEMETKRYYYFNQRSGIKRFLKNNTSSLRFEMKKYIKISSKFGDDSGFSIR